MEENQTQQEVDQTQAQQFPNFLDESNWSEQAPTQEVAAQEQQQETQTQETQTQTESVAEVNEPLKTNLGFESWEQAKSEIEELRKLKEQKPTDLNFSNEDRKKFFELMKEGKEDEVYSYLSEKKKIEKILSSEVNESTAEDIIKLAMQSKYKDLTPDEIDYKIKKQFSIPKEPTIRDTELDSEFEERHNEWKEQVEEVKREKVIEAKLLKPEIEKLKKDIVLPNIPSSSKANEPSQEELDNVQKAREQYLKHLEGEYKNFNGFEVKYKGEDAEIPVTFGVSDEEKNTYKAKMETFDVDSFVLSRWFEQDGTPKITQMFEDIYLLENKDKVLQKVANDTGAKVLAAHIKKVSNIQVNGGGSGTFQPSDPNNSTAKMAEFFLSQ